MKICDIYSHQTHFDRHLSNLCKAIAVVIEVTGVCAVKTICKYIQNWTESNFLCRKLDTLYSHRDWDRLHNGATAPPNVSKVHKIFPIMKYDVQQMATDICLMLLNPTRDASAEEPLLN